MLHTLFKLWASLSTWASGCWVMPLSWHATALSERICICTLDTKTDEWIHFLPPPLFFPSLVCLSVFLFPVGRLVWEEKDPEAETRAEGTEGRHLYACWQERERWSRKIMKFLSLKKKKKEKNRKTRKENEAAPKYLHFLLPMFDILSVCTCFFFLLKWLKMSSKNENIFVKW